MGIVTQAGKHGLQFSGVSVDNNAIVGKSETKPRIGEIIVLVRQPIGLPR